MLFSIRTTAMVQQEQHEAQENMLCCTKYIPNKQSMKVIKPTS